MLIVETYNPQNGQTLSYLYLTSHNEHVKLTPDCMKAAHFRGNIAAAITRQRFPVVDGHPTRVNTCSCPVGPIYQAILNPP